MDIVFSHQTKGAMAQVLFTIPTYAADTFIYKHLGFDPNTSLYLPIIVSAPPEALKNMLKEMLINNVILYDAAPVKHVFKSGVEELERWALHDGWIIENDVLVRVTPAAEEITGIRDKFLQEVHESGLDNDSAINKAIEDSSKDFIAVPPNFNGSITNVRIALETVARRAAKSTSKEKGVNYLEDSWRKALQCLSSHEVIESSEEKILASVYTFISQGAHIPKGITEEEWARLARTFGLSSVYFLLKKYEAS